jgi:hypothetical protein
VTTYNIGDAINLPLNKHWLFATEMDQSRVINFNAPGTLVPQKAVIVREMLVDASGATRFGWAGCPNPCTPNDSGTVEIYIGEIRNLSPPCNNITNPPCDSYVIENQTADGHMIPLVVGHEIGHRIKMPHTVGGAPSIMWEGPPLLLMLNSTWTNAPHSYGPTELTFLQLH